MTVSQVLQYLITLPPATPVELDGAPVVVHFRHGVVVFTDEPVPSPSSPSSIEELLR